MRVIPNGLDPTSQPVQATPAACLDLRIVAPTKAMLTTIVVQVFSAGTALTAMFRA
ncbi:hypothetical protein KRR38_33475 [Novosphingobium sp. G106]|uniref:hypothetical protein n=1 Tax=Novosphingobium sp. G106 TaxID=2849500 RepID=UPI001C2CEE61|nr:hypothetical protein [Novosphingobium sp. G106]MBV1692417.1 hypothetical protein [Novosphingobium sp. G106]